MQEKIYSYPEKAPNIAAEPVVAYQTTTSGFSSSNKWNPNVPFHGTQEEWWDHFHRIEEGPFYTSEEANKKFEEWKREFLASRSYVVKDL